MTPNSYTVIHLTKDNYKDYLPLGEIAAYMYDAPNKEKELGNLSIITADMHLYILDYKQDVFSGVELYELCPPLSANKWSNQTKWKITFWGDKKFCINANIASLFYSYGWVNQRKDEDILYSNWVQWVAEILNNPEHRERIMDAKRAVERFIPIHRDYYVNARNEIRNDRKIFHKDVSQWIFGIFPQPIGLGHSRMSTFNGIESCAEAKAFLDNPYLGKNLREITTILIELDKNDIHEIFIEADAQKVRSSMTLFDLVSPNDIFAQVLEKYYDGTRCELTLQYTSSSKGGILGAILGDIAGSRFEFRNEKSTDVELFTDADAFTDDTVMTIAVADWLMNGTSLPNIMRDWGAEHPYAGYGGMFHRWLFPYDEDDMKPYNSFGNGAGMRVSPCGYIARTLDEALDLAKQSAEVSHNHPEGIKGAQAIAAAIFLARQHTPKEEICRYIEKVFGYDLQRTCDDIRPDYGFNETCQGSCPEAIIAFLDSTDYESAIRLAISLGGDSDTIACMTGGIAAAYYGIPNWIVEKAVKYLPADMIEIINRFDGRELKKKY